MKIRYFNFLNLGPSTYITRAIAFLPIIESGNGLSICQCGFIRVRSTVHVISKVVSLPKDALCHGGTKCKKFIQFCPLGPNERRMSANRRPWIFGEAVRESPLRDDSLVRKQCVCQRLHRHSNGTTGLGTGSFIAKCRIYRSACASRPRGS